MVTPSDQLGTSLPVPWCWSGARLAGQKPTLHWPNPAAVLSHGRLRPPAGEPPWPAGGRRGGDPAPAVLAPVPSLPKDTQTRRHEAGAGCNMRRAEPRQDLLVLQGAREGLREGGEAQAAAEARPGGAGAARGDGAAGTFGTSGQAESKGQGWSRHGTSRWHSPFAGVTKKTFRRWFTLLERALRLSRGGKLLRDQTALEESETPQANPSVIKGSGQM